MSHCFVQKNNRTMLTIVVTVLVFLLVAGAVYRVWYSYEPTLLKSRLHNLSVSLRMAAARSQLKQQTHQQQALLYLSAQCKLLAFSNLKRNLLRTNTNPEDNVVAAMNALNFAVKHSNFGQDTALPATFSKVAAILAYTPPTFAAAKRWPKLLPADVAEQMVEREREAERQRQEELKRKDDEVKRTTDELKRQRQELEQLQREKDEAQLAEHFAEQSAQAEVERLTKEAAARVAASEGEKKAAEEKARMATEEAVEAKKQLAMAVEMKKRAEQDRQAAEAEKQQLAQQADDYAMLAFSVIRWQCLLDEGAGDAGYVPYDQRTSADIEAAYQRFTAKRQGNGDVLLDVDATEFAVDRAEETKVDVLGQHYSIDFVQMRQTSAAGKHRPVRRLLLGNSECELVTLSAQNPAHVDELNQICGPGSEMRKQIRGFSSDRCVVQRIQNAFLWRHYQYEKHAMAQKNNGEVNELVLFHGTSSTAPSLIFNGHIGFDHRLSNRRSFYGQGIYFAQNPNYSHKLYAHVTAGPVGSLRAGPDRQLRQLILAKVLCGRVYHFGREINNDLVRPPPLSAKSLVAGSGLPPAAAAASFRPSAGSTRPVDLYDSVSGDPNTGTLMYVIFDNRQSYPAWLITYEADAIKHGS